MSFIDLLFPMAEVEALGNKWSEPPTKRRKLDLNAGPAQSPQQPIRRHTDGFLDQRRSTVSAPSGQTRKTALASQTTQRPVKRSKSDTKPSRPSLGASIRPQETAAPKPAPPKSCLPSFIEPTIMKNYLQHLHPSDRSRYSIPNSPEPMTQSSHADTPGKSQHQQDGDIDSASPASLVTDHSSTSEGNERCMTPTETIYEQLRTTPFGYLIHGLRLTEHERNLMEDLLGPDQVHGQPSQQDSTAASKRKASTLDPGFRIADLFPSDIDQTAFGPGSLYGDDGNFDVHSSGLSPAALNQDEDEDELPAKEEYKEEAVLSTRGFAITVDDFFDLEEASGFTDLD